MIPTLSLLDSSKVRVQLLTGREQRAVDPLQLRPFFIAPPVRAGNVGQPKRADLLGRLNMPASTEVGEIGVRADPHLLRVGRELVEQLLLEGLVTEPFARLGDRNLVPDEPVIAADFLPHSLLDLREVLGSQRARQIEVVVEAGVDRWTDANLAVGEHLQHDLGQHVRSRVPHSLQPLGIVDIASARNGDGGGFVRIPDRAGVVRVVCHPPAISAGSAQIALRFAAENPVGKMVGDTGLEPVTSAMSTQRSSQLS